ncbi:hypothetical protein, partial [Corynebacterium minutissimum]|uniref:hypothetical protein n=1 Tax=Corynebacterium minutissimum TaxID=38301 RepID=UPI001B8092CF
LHRLSMPRHPPCALNNEHTTNTQHNKRCLHVGVNYTKHKRTEITQTMTPTTNNQPRRPANKMVITAHGLMLASTIQFSHNTPHQQHNHQAKAIDSVLPAWVDIQGIMPQTPNNAPTYL